MNTKYTNVTGNNYHLFLEILATVNVYSTDWAVGLLSCCVEFHNLGSVGCRMMADSPQNLGELVCFFEQSCGRPEATGLFDLLPFLFVILLIAFNQLAQAEDSEEQESSESNKLKLLTVTSVAI